MGAGEALVVIGVFGGIGYAMHWLAKQPKDSDQEDDAE